VLFQVRTIIDRSGQTLEGGLWIHKRQQRNSVMETGLVIELIERIDSRVIVRRIGEEQMKQKTQAR
jgi:hypothetical protein